MNEYTCIYYLNDTIKQIIEMAKKAQLSKNEFDVGILQGYYLSLSKLLNQADTFGLLEKLDNDIKNFDPDSLFDDIE